MNISARYTNLGIILSFGDKPRERLVPIEGTPQHKPRRCYVYAHVAPDGKYFYIGRGTGKRAWKGERHFLWHRYVNTRLKGKFSVIILQDNLSFKKAEWLESEWIAQEGRTLVNWINSERQTDNAMLNRLNKLRDENRNLMNRAKAAEKTDLNGASKMYIQAIADFDVYADMDIECELGLVGQLMKEWRAEGIAEVGRSGKIEAMDRLSLCLVKLGKAKEAEQHMQEYFKKYKADVCLPVSERIRRRVEKALSKKIH